MESNFLGGIVTEKKMKKRNKNKRARSETEKEKKTGEMNISNSKDNNKKKERRPPQVAVFHVEQPETGVQIVYKEADFRWQLVVPHLKNHHKMT